jgi:hypothetical protein
MSPQTRKGKIKAQENRFFMMFFLIIYKFGTQSNKLFPINPNPPLKSFEKACAFGGKSLSLQPDRKGINYRKGINLR